MRQRFFLAMAAVLAASSAWAAESSATRQWQERVVEGSTVSTVYGHDSPSDLLTAGMTWESLGKPVVPGDPANREEIRRLAILGSYHGLISLEKADGFTEEGGYGILPRVSGTEYKAYAFVTDGRDGGSYAVVMAQIPDGFDPAKPCIVTAPASGSRGVYGAISTAETAFRLGCVVAYTDKGTGVGVHDLKHDRIFDRDGMQIPAAEAKPGDFRVVGAPATEFRVAIKHAHAGVNGEKYWGRHVLQSIRFSRENMVEWMRQRRHSQAAIDRMLADLVVVAAGMSNGGGAVLRAAEQDDDRLIDGVVVGEPQVQPVKGKFVIRYGGNDLAGHSRDFYDIVTTMNLYAPCAAGTPEGVKRCRALWAAGYLGTAKATPADARLVWLARDKLRGYGILPEADALLDDHQGGFLHLWRVLAPVYGSAYAQAKVTDRLCDVSFGCLDKDCDAWSGQMALHGGIGNGLPSGPVRIIVGNVYDGVDNLRAAQCWRDMTEDATLRASLAEIKATGRLLDRPAIILHGRRDGLIAPNHSSRPYYGLTQTGGARLARYIEVAEGNHFDALLKPFRVNDPGLVAMHVTFGKAVEKVLEVARAKRAGMPSAALEAMMPDSQVLSVATWKCALPLRADKANAITFGKRGRQAVLEIPAGDRLPDIECRPAQD